ncbi:hypothetical protein [Streptomyces sp. ISL-100]|uniref:hypothetical protein n=1 Tax=Streptomyces sp. ISL-100 TaxID=2819173 RepID=UPI001BEB811D|nr:hypothetical protein [Streptomyces sp. ISL-100]MBT2395179.1 hypothetical protein [Streptomyces sp. ISL-100]
MLKWGGLAGVAVCLLLRYIEPASGWDVLAYIGVALLGPLISWAPTRRKRAASRDVPEAAAPTSPTGFLPHGDWRPDRTQRQRLSVLPG